MFFAMPYTYYGIKVWKSVLIRSMATYTRVLQLQTRIKKLLCFHTYCGSKMLSMWSMSEHNLNMDTLLTGMILDGYLVWSMWLYESHFCSGHNFYIGYLTYS